MSYASKVQKNALSGQIDIFGSLGMEDSLPGIHMALPSEVASQRDQLSWEKELIGLYLSRHPLDEYDEYIVDHALPLNVLTPEMEGQPVKIAGMTTTVRKITTKNGATMAFVGLEDKTGALELIVFPRAYEKNPGQWEVDKVLQINGKVSAKDRDGRLGTEVKVMVDSAYEISYDLARGHESSGKSFASKADLPVPKVKRVVMPATHPTATSPDIGDEVEVDPSLVINLKSLTDTNILTELKQILGESPGETKIYLVLPTTPIKRILLTEKVAISDALIDRLNNAIGEGSATRVHV